MGYVLLGHGGIDVSSADELPGSYQPGMGIVAIPPNTTLQCFSDAGQKLVITDTLVEMWSVLDAPWPAMTSENVTYNLGLEEFSDTEVIEEIIRWGANDTGGHELLIAGNSDLLGSNELMCTGSVDTCPTDPRLQQAHQCDGILGRFAGHDLFWVACTTFALPGQEEATQIDFDLPGAREAIAAARSFPVAILSANPDDIVESAKTYITGMGEIGEQALVIKMLSPDYGWDLTDEQRNALLADGELSEVVARHRTTFGY
jgi:hypothetical protein